MNELIKCPECGGNKCEHVAGNSYRCLYCGTTIIMKSTPVPPPISNNANYVAPPPPVNPASNQQPMLRDNRDKTTTILLTIFLGGLGIQWFYLGKNVFGVLSLIFCWTWIPSIIALIQFIMLLSMSTEEFNRKYN